MSLKFNNAGEALTSNAGLENLKSFIRISALTILVMYFFVEVQFADLSYRVITVLDIIRFPVLRIPFFPSMTLNFASFGWYPIFVELFFIFAMVLVLVLPFSRIARNLALLAIVVRLLSSHLGTGVHLTTFYLVPFILFSVHNFKTQSNQQLLHSLVTAMACMYFFSAVFKLNSHYLAGDLLKFDSLIRDSTKDLLHQFNLFPSIAWSGIILELLGSLVFLGKFRRLSLLAALTFHLGVALCITWSFRLQLTSASLLLLFLPNEKIFSYFKSLCVFVVSHAISHYFLNIAALNWFPQANHLLQDLHGIFFGIAIYVHAVYTLFSNQIDVSFRWSYAAIAIAILYASIAFFLAWPEPFGYTQYSGRTREYFGISINKNWIKKQPDLVRLKGRWSVKVLKDVFENETTYLFPFKETQIQFEKYICDIDSKIFYSRVQTDRKLNVETGNPDRSELVDSLMRSRLNQGCPSK